MFNFGEFIFYYDPKELRNTKDIVPTPTELFIKFLVETKQVASYTGADNEPYVKLIDLLPYRGTQIPNVNYPMDAALNPNTIVEYSTEFQLTNFEDDILYLVDTKEQLPMDFVLNALIGEKSNIKGISNIYKYIADNMSKDLLKDANITAWFDDTPTIKTQHHYIGSADWNYFAYFDDKCLVTIIDDDLSFYGVFSKKHKISPIVWESIYNLFCLLGCDNKIFSAKTIYEIDLNVFLRLVYGEGIATYQFYRQNPDTMKQEVQSDNK